jgi:hypothetical protein
MEFTLTTPALLFSAISLLLLAYTNRFLALAALIRELHRQYVQSKDDIILRQIGSLKRRVQLIKFMQLLGVVAFFLCTLSMFILFTAQVIWSEVAFGLALIALMGSLGLSVVEIYVSVDALSMRLSDIEQKPPPR